MFNSIIFADICQVVSGGFFQDLKFIFKNNPSLHYPLLLVRGWRLYN